MNKIEILHGLFGYNKTFQGLMLARGTYTEGEWLWKKDLDVFKLKPLNTFEIESRSSFKDSS